MQLGEGERMAAWLEQAWLSRYLDRELNDDERAWFEAYMLDSPQLVRQVEADSDVRDAMHVAPATFAASQSIVRMDQRLRRYAGPVLSAAAVLALGIGIGSTLPEARDEGGATFIASPTRLFYDMSRGGVAEPTVFEGRAESGMLLIEVALPLGADDVSVVVGKTAPMDLALPDNDSVVSFVIDEASARDAGAATISYSDNGSMHTLRIALTQPGETQ